jgi:hypothetical protein
LTVMAGASLGPYPFPIVAIVNILGTPHQAVASLELAKILREGWPPCQGGPDLPREYEVKNLFAVAPRRCGDRGDGPEKAFGVDADRVALLEPRGGMAAVPRLGREGTGSGRARPRAYGGRCESLFGAQFQGHHGALRPGWLDSDPDRANKLAALVQYLLSIDERAGPART